MNRVSYAERAGIGLFLPGDHAEERRLAGSVGTDDADDAAGRKLERKIVDQQPVAVSLLQPVGLDDDIAETLAGGNHDLSVAGAPFGRRLDQFVVGLDAGLRLGLARLGALAHPFALTRQRPLAGRFLASLLGHALGLLFQVGRVVALVGDAPATVELEDPAGHVVQEVSVVGDHQHRTGIFAKMLFQPSDRFCVEVVRRFVEEQQVGLRQQQLAERHPALLATGKIVDGGISRRAAQCIHRHLDLAVQVPEVLRVDDVLQLRALLGRFVRIVHHQLVVAVEDRSLVGDPFHHVAGDVEVLVELRLLRQVADGGALRDPGLPREFLVEPSHDPQYRRLAGTVGAEDADLGIRDRTRGEYSRELSCCRRPC